jgi:hypothetical protein
LSWLWSTAITVAEPASPAKWQACCEANRRRVSQSSCIVSGEMRQITWSVQENKTRGFLEFSALAWKQEQEPPSAPLPNHRPISRPLGPVPCAPAACGLLLLSVWFPTQWLAPPSSIVAAETRRDWTREFLRSCQFPSASVPLPSPSSPSSTAPGLDGLAAWLFGLRATAAFSNRSDQSTRPKSCEKPEFRRVLG